MLNKLKLERYLTTLYLEGRSQSHFPWKAVVDCRCFIIVTSTFRGRKQLKQNN